MALSMLRALVIFVLCGVILAEPQVAPIWAWGPADSISPTGVHYEARPAGDVLVSLLRPWRGAGIVLASKGQDPSLTGDLKSIVSSAGSWAEYPNTVGDPDVVPRALRELRDSGAPGAHVVGTCDGLPAGLPATTSELRPLLGSGGAAQTLVVLCAGDQTEERALLNEATRLVGASGEVSPLVVVLTVPGYASGSLHDEAQRRRLATMQATTALGWSKYSAQNRTQNYTVCDPVCKTQTKYLEALIVFVVVAIAVGVGLTCLHIIDTPTRFPPTKEAQRQHHE